MLIINIGEYQVLSLFLSKGGFTMEIILLSVFSALIILITIYFLIKLFIAAYMRKEISFRKFLLFSTSSILIGLIVVSVLPFGYQKIIDYIY